MKYLVIAALLVSTVAQAAPVERKFAVEEATKREQLIRDMMKPPASVFNVCRGC